MDRVAWPTNIEFVKIYQLRVVKKFRFETSLKYAFLVLSGTFSWHINNENIFAYSHTIKAWNGKVARPRTHSISLWTPLGLPGPLGKVSLMWLYLFCLSYIYIYIYIYIILLMRQRPNIILKWYFMAHGPQNFALKLRSRGSLHLDNFEKALLCLLPNYCPTKKFRGQDWSCYDQPNISRFQVSHLCQILSFGRNLVEMSM